VYFISPGKYAFEEDEKPLNCSGEFAISSASINNLSAIKPNG
jgi:hypothetical protein